MKFWITVAGVLGVLNIAFSFLLLDRIQRLATSTAALSTDIAQLTIRIEQTELQTKQLTAKFDELQKLAIGTNREVEKFGVSYQEVIKDLTAAKATSASVGNLSERVTDIQQRLGSARIEAHKATGAPIVRIDPK